MSALLPTPFHRALFAVCCLAFIAGAVWRAETVPIGEVHPYWAETVRLPASSEWFLFPQKTDATQTAAAQRFGWNFMRYGGTCQRDVNPLAPTSPGGMLEFGLFFCNEANAPPAVFNAMRPAIRSAALRDWEAYALRILAIPAVGLAFALALGATGLSGRCLLIWIASGR
ncbi:MAG: hypothetical protein KGN33_09475 [Paracoccaceae bacterium]|nr:hypothetical protein [Paracoccaceae bacterium]